MSCDLFSAESNSNDIPADDFALETQSEGIASMHSTMHLISITVIKFLDVSESRVCLRLTVPFLNRKGLFKSTNCY